MEKKKFETPYIRVMELDSRDHVMVSKSDGEVINVGYLHTRSLKIRLRDKKEREDEE